jgi:UDP-2,3-diacylglucosamine pyrophosphatase LpxH
MAESAVNIKGLRFNSIESVANGLQKKDVTPQDYGKLVLETAKVSPYKTRMMVKAILRITPSMKDRQGILDTARRNRNPKLRHQVIQAYREARADSELITGLSLMTTHDAAKFFKDYFTVGGTTKEVSEWLAHISARYVLEKRKGNIDPEYSGFWDDVWDSIVDVVETIGDAITTVVDAVIEAGKTFAEVVGDIVGYVQGRLNDIVEALLDAGRELGEIILGAIEAGTEFVGKIFRAILAAGKAVVDILTELFEKAVDFIKDGIELLVKIEARIKNILSAALELGIDILKDVVQQLIDLGHTAWYVLKWATNLSFEVLQGVVEKLLEIGKEVGSLLLWFSRRTLGILQKGLQILLALGHTLEEILYTIFTDPRHLVEKTLQALKDLGKTVYDFFSAVANFGVDMLKQVYRTLVSIGMSVVDMLEFFLFKGKQIFREGIDWLLKAGVKSIDILLWVVEKSFEIFGWAIQVIDTFINSFLDIVEWASQLGGRYFEFLVRWLAETGRSAFEWFKTKVIEPILQAGKLVLVITLALANLPLLALAYFSLRSLVDAEATDYKHWPSRFEDFKTAMSDRLVILPDVDQNHKYVVVSDLHMESQADVDSGIGHFYKNAGLLARVLSHYAEDPTWTIIGAGDEQEFWYNADLSYLSNPEKVDMIMQTHPAVFDDLSNSFYKYKSPRQYVKVRGNHDDVYRESGARNRFRDGGFPNIEVYDYAVVNRNDKPILIMHGQQFDQYNCDANNFFGKFSSNFVGEPIDELNDTLESIFGSGARIEGWALAPFYTRSEWLPTIDDGVANPKISDDPMFSEKLATVQMRNFDCSIVMGHTHGPKLMKDGQNDQRFYANTGTCGWWEGCVWTVEIKPDDVILSAWTSESDQAPFRTFILSETEAVFA